MKKYWNINIIFSLFFLMTNYTLESANSTTKNYNNSSEIFNQVKGINYSWIKGSCWTGRLSNKFATTINKIYFAEKNKYYSHFTSIGHVTHTRDISKFKGKWRQDRNSIIVKYDGKREEKAKYIILSENSIMEYNQIRYARGC